MYRIEPLNTMGLGADRAWWRGMVMGYVYSTMYPSLPYAQHDNINFQDEFKP